MQPLQKRTLLLFAAGCTLFSLFVAKADRYFLKKNNGFSVAHLYPISCSALSASYPLPSSVEEILSQDFTYLGRGHQSYVFASHDGNYVLKFYRFPSHLTKCLSLRSLSYRFRDRQEAKLYNLDKLEETLSSYQIAYEKLPQETGLLWVHLQPTNNLKKNITLIDRLGVRYQVEIDPLYFLVQKRARLVFPVFEELLAKNDLENAKRAINKLFSLIASRCQKNIADQDAVLEKNYGFLDEMAIHIDAGRFMNKEFCKEEIKKEIARITQPLQTWLQQRSSELYCFYLEELGNY